MGNTLKNILSKGIEWEYLLRNPADITVRLPRQKKREIEPYSPEEVATLLDYVPERNYALFVVAIWAGMRLGEILAMKWANVDWVTGRYYVRETLTKRREFEEVLKTEGSEAPVPLSPFVLRALERHKGFQAEQRLLMGGQWEEYGLVSPSEKGTPMAQHQVTVRLFRRAIEDAGLRPIRFHDLRHTCATLMIEKNRESPKTVQKQLRHESVITTLNVYGHFFPEDQDKAAVRMDELIWQGGAPL